MKGEITDAEQPFVSELGGVRDTVVAGWVAQDWDESGEASNWVTEAGGIASVPFAIDDGTGEVWVEPGIHDAEPAMVGVGRGGSDVTAGGVDVDFAAFPTVGEYEPGEEPPFVREFVARYDAVDEQSGSFTNVIDVGKKHGTRRYKEGQLRIGDEVYVLGNVESLDGSTGRLRPEDAVIRPPDEDDEVDWLLLSDEPEANLVEEPKHSRLAYPGGYLLLAVGIVLALLAAVIAFA